MSGILDIRNVALQLGGRLLFANLNLAVRPGELVCVTGSSGCGKTSLLRGVLGFLPFQEGTVCVDGEKLGAHTVDRIRRKIAYVPQDLFRHEESVEEMVRLLFTLKANRECAFSEERLFRIWDLLGLEHEVMRQKVMQLSGGQRQRIMLSVAAMLDKKLLLADEPTSALDDDSVGRVVELFRRLAGEGMAVLVVSHNKKLMDACDLVVTL